MSKENNTAPTSACRSRGIQGLPGLAGEGAAFITSAEKSRIRARAHYYLHREEILIRRRADYAANREKYTAINKASYKKHCDARKAQAHLYRLAHLEERHIKDRAYYAANKQKLLDCQRRIKYGLTREAFDNMVNLQGGVCAICGVKNWNGRKPHVDHDHISGQVRGILCHRCNSAIGLVGEKIIVLVRMIEYLNNKGIIPKIKDHRQAEMMKRMAEIFLAATNGSDGQFLRKKK